MNKLLLSAAVIAATLVCASQPQAQQAAPRRVPATIVLTDSLPTGTGNPFIIQRRPNLTPRDVILIRPGADAGQLSDAIRAILTARQAGGDIPATQATLRIRPHSASPAGRGAAARGANPGTAEGGRRTFPWSQRVLDDLRRAEVQSVAGIGRVRAVQIWLPAQRGAARVQGEF